MVLNRDDKFEEHQTEGFCTLVSSGWIPPDNKYKIINCTYLMRTPIDFRNACVNASVLLISSEKISLPAMDVKGVSIPRACAIPELTKSIEIDGIRKVHELYSCSISVIKPV